MEVDRYQHLAMRSSFRFSFLGVYALDGTDVQLSVFQMSRVEDHLLCGWLSVGGLWLAHQLVEQRSFHGWLKRQLMAACDFDIF